MTVTDIIGTLFGARWATGVDLVTYDGDFVVAYRSDLQQASCGIIYIVFSLQTSVWLVILTALIGMPLWL